MAVNRDVTWDVPTPSMSEPTSEPLASAPEPFGAWRALRILLAFLGVQLVVALFAGIRAVLRGGRGLHGTAPPSGELMTALLMNALVAGLIGTVLAGLCVLLLLGRAFAQPGGEAVRSALGFLPASSGASARAALTGFALALGYLVLGGLSPQRPVSLGPLARAAAAGGVPRLLWAGLAVVAPPIEEVVFRGVLFAGLSRSWGRVAAALTTTALFVALHGTEIGRYVPGWIVIGVLGVLTLRARIATGSLVPAIALHAAYNLSLVAVAFSR
jgi:membrane protease YdiL (CAAX protease family)